MNTILIVEDDPNIRKLMKEVLAQHGYEAVVATDGEDALDVMDKTHIDLMVVDIMMPRMDGYELTRILRESGSQVPILMATAKEDFDYKKKGFNFGADDYMTKPLNEEELLLRIGALLRRSKIANDSVLSVGGTALFYDELAVLESGKDRQLLPKKEFLLLFKLLSYPNKIFTRRQLIDEIWSMESETDERTVDVHINRLRDRFRESPDFELVTVRGLGYKAAHK
ncbi:MAG: response regulator transcription factor [Turicibacter sp.]|nr:response regulator transcription factor [Turicibacter sp.]